MSPAVTGSWRRDSSLFIEVEGIRCLQPNFRIFVPHSAAAAFVVKSRAAEAKR